MIPRSDYISNLSLCDRFRFVKGSVIECGTWKGGMIAGIATVLGPTRAYYLYDSFQGLPAANEEDAVDGSSGREWEGRLATTKEFAEEAMRLSGASDYRIIPGWFKDTLPTYAGGPIAILRIDGDFYDSVLDTLNNLYDKVVNGGIVIIDDYYCWHGARRAVHDFLSANRLLDTLWQHRGGEYVYMLKHRGREVESKC